LPFVEVILDAIVVHGERRLGGRSQGHDRRLLVLTDTDDSEMPKIKRKRSPALILRYYDPVQAAGGKPWYETILAVDKF
jgi:hypothetical protein